MSGSTAAGNPSAPPQFPELLGHPRPLWMLFMSEFWERFAFYGMRWALVLYVVAQFHAGDAAGEAPANHIYGAYLALVYAAAIFGGLVADRVLGYQRSILLGAVFMAAGLFLITVPDERLFRLGLATIVCGNGLFKPIISTMVGKLYATGDPRRDSGFTIFYMGINAGAFIAPILTEWLAKKYGADGVPAYKYVFLASGVGMLISFVWFWLGRNQLQGIGAPTASQAGAGRFAAVALGVLGAIPLVYGLFSIGAETLQWYVLTPMFIGLCLLLLVEGMREGNIQRDKVIAMLLIFTFNILFWVFFEQAGSSFTFLAEKIVDRQVFGFDFSVAWFQSVNSLAIIAFAPLIAMIWVWLGRNNPSIPRKFGLGLIFNGLAFLLLMFALTKLVDDRNMIPFWTLFTVYVIQSIGELCLSPIGLSMVTKLAPTRLVGFGMGGWFLSTGIGNNLSGIFAAEVSGETGMTTASALSGYTFGFWALVGAGVFLFLIAPLIQKLMHGVE